MKEESILNQIITKNQQQSWSDFNIINIIDQLFKQLNQREQDVLTRRFGLRGQSKETLESIGQEYNLTRERIRQIETSGLNKLKKSQEFTVEINQLKQAVSQLLSEHGGLMSRKHLFNALAELSASQEINRSIYDSHLNFLIIKILDRDIDYLNNSSYFHQSFKLKHQTLNHLEVLAEELLARIKNDRRLLDTQELLNIIKQTRSFQSNQDKLLVVDNSDLQQILPQDLPTSERVLYAFLQALKEVEQNKFGYWGHRTWREINPKTINDKIYLVLKNQGQPMYYGDIAQKIAELNFDQKKVNPATTHNELILDDKYILVGRGLYGLKEWGYKDGTVSDVIVAILQEANQPLSKQEIIDKVLGQRLVKQTTINLALMNKEIFTKTSDNKYKLKS